MKWQVRSNAFTSREEPAVSVVEADHLQFSGDGGLAFFDKEGIIVCLLQKDSWNDVVRIT